MAVSARSIYSALVIACVCIIVPQGAVQAADKECSALMKQVNDVVDRVARVSERIGAVEERIDRREAIEQNKQTVEKDKKTLRKDKVTIDNLADKICACCGKTGPGATARPSKECGALIKQVNDVVDRVARVSERIGAVEERIDRGEAVEQNKQTVEKDKNTLRKDKVTIDNLLDKICACCGKKSETTGQPTPSTTDKVTDALKTIGSSISIGIGGGTTDGGHDRHERVRGEDRTKTAEKLKDH